MRKRVKENICMLLAVIIMATAFLSNNVMVEAARPKNITYYIDCTGVKLLKKSHGKLIVTAKKRNPLNYNTTNGTRNAKKISYKLAKNCKWSLSDPSEVYYSKSSYKKTKKLVKQLDWQSVLTVKVRKGKVVRVNISSP